ncbi:MAG: hypothetical protein J1G01_04425 [Clostridiales bacterium]|nr:hypothetical protein [Clostridiales bacterium]
MELKLIEIRDRGTTIAALAIKMSPEREGDIHFLRRSGFGIDSSLVYLIKVEGQEAHYDAFQWRNRTMHEAHRYIQQHFDELKDCDLVDVEYILGESNKPKTSEIWR